MTTATDFGQRGEGMTEILGSSPFKDGDFAVCSPVPATNVVRRDIECDVNK